MCIPEGFKHWIKQSRMNKMLMVLVMFWLASIILTPFLILPWVSADLNQELGIEIPQTYSDDNTTVMLYPTKSGNGHLEDRIESNYIASDQFTEIRMNHSQWSPILNICYMEVLTYNKSELIDTNNWFLNLTSGSQDPRIHSWPHTVYVPPQPVHSRIFYKIRLVSTDFNQTYSTQTNLNGMILNYSIYYSNAELEIDRVERSVSHQYILELQIFTPFTILIAAKRPIDDDSDEINSESEMWQVSRSDAPTWIRYIAGRVDLIETRRHNLIIEAEILLAILGAIVGYSIFTQVEPLMTLIILLLTIPQLVAIIILMMGAKSEDAKEISSTNPNVVVEALRLSISRGNKLVDSTRSVIASGSFYAIEAIILIAFTPNTQYHNVLILLLFSLWTFTILSIIYFVATHIHSSLNSVEVDNEPGVYDYPYYVK